MPRIEHIALWVENLDAVCSFYAKAFAAQIGPRYDNRSKGFASRFLSFDSGSRVEVMTTTRESLIHPPPGAQRMGLTHVAISLGSEDAVRELTERLRSEGVPILDGPRRTGDGYFESVVLDPEGNRIELTA
jgi:lactoylglutathione lyase